MRADHQSERPKGEVQTETGEPLKGPKPLNLSKEKQVLSKGAPGEERTPDMPIGQVAHADRSFQLGENMENEQLDGSKRAGTRQ